MLAITKTLLNWIQQVYWEKMCIDAMVVFTDIVRMTPLSNLLLSMCTPSSLDAWVVFKAVLWGETFVTKTNPKS